MQGHVRRSQRQMVAAAVRQVFAAAEFGEARSAREVVLLTTR
jgi:hypothetical protein